MAAGAGGLRKSHYIRGKQASRFFKATKHSEGSQQPLNLFVTLNLTHTTCLPQLASKAVSRICAKFGRWLRYQSKKALLEGKPGYGPPNYGTVLEAPGGLHHVHWLVHVPDELQPLFEKTLPKWLSKAAGKITIPAGAIHIEPIDTVMALSRYCMKGVDPHHAKRCYVLPKEQGEILGKRVAISRSLGPTARRKAAAAGKSCVSGSASRTGISQKGTTNGNSTILPSPTTFPLPGVQPGSP